MTKEAQDDKGRSGGQGGSAPERSRARTGQEPDKNQARTGQESGKGPCKKGHEIPTKGGREEEAGDRDKRCVNKRSFI